MNQTKKSNVSTSVLLIGVLFSIFGLITWLNGALMQFLKTACELTQQQASLVTFAFFISYFVMAIPSSAILQKTGFKKGMSLGLVVMSVGCLLFIPAAYQRNYLIFLAGLFTQGLGLTILQSASNPYVTIVGPIESAAKRISIMGICNKLAGALGSYVLAQILLSPINKIEEKLTDSAVASPEVLDQLAQKIILPYGLLAAFLVVVAIFVTFSPLPEIEDETQDAGIARAERPLGSYVYLFLGAFAIFVYVGVEVLAGDMIIPYGTALELKEYAKYLTSLTLAFMLGGYGLGVLLIPKVISQEAALRINVICSILLSFGVMLLPPKASVVCLAFLGFFHAIMWPAIWPMSIKGLGRHTKIGSALLIMCIVGGGVIPFLYSTLADHYHNMQQAFWILIPCYAYLLFFATIGHKIGYKEAKRPTT